jgi:hypothetical protein
MNHSEKGSRRPIETLGHDELILEVQMLRKQVDSLTSAIGAARKSSKSDYFVDPRQVQYRDTTQEKCHGCGHERFHHRIACAVDKCVCLSFFVDRR